MTRILVAEDDPIGRYLLEAILRGAGFEVESVENGAEALVAARARPPDLLITDLLMPVMDGFVLCRTWKTDEALRRIPFVVYTATYTKPKDEQLALDLGADAFLLKPADPDVLVARIRALLEVGARVSPKAPSTDEKTQLEEYSGALVRKLEDKIRELEAAKERLVDVNRELEERVRERTRELELHNDELEAFAAEAAHDLRAPLRSMSAFAAIVLEDVGDRLGAEAKDAATRVVAGAVKLDQLVRDLLQLTRASRQPLAVRAVDLDRVARDVLLVRSPSPTEHVTIGLLPAVMGDEALLSLVVQNLVDNAVRYREASRDPVVEITCEVAAGDVTVHVADNGIGFETSQAERIFAPFVRLQSEPPGSGVGLALARRIVERHGGAIWASSTLGRGSVFSFRLPRAHAT